MAKLNQIIAIEKGIKSRANGDVTTLYKTVQKPDIFNGFSKDYKKKDEDGESLPPERRRVQYTAEDVLRSVERSMTELMEVTARKDWTNCQAHADVKMDDQILIPKAPVSYLLFLEKQLTDMHTFVTHLPILDENEKWSKDENSGLYKAEETQTHRTKKLQKPIVLYDATAEHPAQTQLITEDVIVGFWHTVKQSGAMPKPEVAAMAQRIQKLLRAIKEAREEANSREEIKTPNVGAAVFTYLLGK